MNLQSMVDIETLSSEPDGAIIAIGLCVFNEGAILDSSEILIDPRLAPGHRNPDTLNWWNEQDPEVFKKMMSGTIPPWTACEIMNEHFKVWEPKTLWANPPTFDISMLRHLFKMYDQPFPMHYTSERDFRTMKSFAKEMGIDYSEPYNSRTAHDAESDAICQAQALQIILRDLALI